MKEIRIFCENIQPPKLSKTLIKNKIKYLIEREKKVTGEISVIFCSDEYLLDVNIKYLNHNYLTDIITFDYVEGDIISGDLFISIDRVKENAEKFKVSWQNELLRVIFHGILHLIGYNDKTDYDKKKMREKEDYYLESIEIKSL